MIAPDSRLAPDAGQPRLLCRRQPSRAEVVLQLREPRGGERYGVFHDLEGWRGYLAAAGFTELEHYFRPAGLPLAQQPWLASVWRKA